MSGKEVRHRLPSALVFAMCIMTAGQLHEPHLAEPSELRSQRKDFPSLTPRARPAAADC